MCGENSKCWSEDSISSLQECFDCTDWQCFYDACDDINELSDTVSIYITFCVDSVIPIEMVVTYPNNKPWVTKELKSVIIKCKGYITLAILWIKRLSPEKCVMKFLYLQATRLK